MQDVKNVVVHNLSVCIYINICNLEGNLDVNMIITAICFSCVIVAAWNGHNGSTHVRSYNKTSWMTLLD